LSDAVAGQAIKFAIRAGRLHKTLARRIGRVTHAAAPKRRQRKRHPGNPECLV